MILFLLRCWQCGVVLLVGVSAALAQPRAEQVDPSALAAAAARLGRVVWSPVATVDRIGVDPFVLRLPTGAECLDRNVYCPPVYRSDFVLGGRAGADVWMNLSERLLVQSSGRAVVDWYREFSDQRSLAPDFSQAVRYVGPRFHLDFGWRHVESRRGMLSEVAQRVRRAAFDRRLTTAVRLGRFALEAEWGDQRVRYRAPRVAHQSFRYAWFNADIGRTRAVFRPAVAGPSRWAVSVERLGHRSVSRPLRQRRLDATTVMLETELLTGLRLEGRVGIGWTRERRPDYHPQLGIASAALSAPVWRIDLALPSEAADLDIQLRRRFTQSVLPGPPALDDFRIAVRGGRRLGTRLRADALVQAGRLLYLDRVDPSTSRRGRIDVARIAATDKAKGATGLTPGHWIAIATIAVAVLGGVLGWALSEHNARLANVESDIRNIAEAQARTEGEIKAIHERLDGFGERLDGFGERLNRIETGIDRLIQLHLDAETTQPAAARAEQPAS